MRNPMKTVIRCLLCVIFLAPSVGTAQIAKTEFAEALPTTKKLAHAAKKIVDMKSTLDLALTRLEKARDNKDIIQINCVNEKLSDIRGLLKISEEAKASLDEAAAKRDKELINHEYTKISIAGMRVENFRLEVEGCVGEMSQYTGNTIADVQIDPDIRKDDPATAEIVPTFEALNTSRPPAVTGSR
jgi:hypothetical protein